MTKTDKADIYNIVTSCADRVSSYMDRHEVSRDEAVDTLREKDTTTP